MAKKRESRIRVDSAAGGYLLNRYLAYTHQTIYNTKGTLAENVPIKITKSYKIQWKNIRRDLKGVFQNPLRVAPQIAYSLLAFFYIFQGKHLDAYLTSFVIGSIAFDASAQTSHSGEPSEISWEHTIGSDADRIICIHTDGLNATNASKFDANDTTSIVTEDNQQDRYYLNPDTGAANCTCDGGNIKVGGSISFSGVDQDDPIGATTSLGSGTSPQDVSLTTDTDNSIRVDTYAGRNEDSTEHTGTLDSGTERHNDVVTQNQFRLGIFGYTNVQASAGADTHA